MRSILSSVVLAAATFSLSVLADFNPANNTAGQDPNNAAAGLQLRTPVDLGCYSNPEHMIDMGVYTFQAIGWCQPLCVRQSMNYFALVNGSNCFCGNDAPSDDYKVPSSDCNKPCRGFDKAFCGGVNFWDVQDSGYQVGDPTGSIVIQTPAPTWTNSLYATATASSSTTAAQTVVVTKSPTAAPTATSAPAGQSSGPPTAAIAAGVVVSIVLVFAIAGGIFFFLRRRKQQAFLEEQRRHEMMTNFVTREKPGSGYTSPDARLDPSLMFQRRLSDGSIRDNEDYSRRILKVANPDD